MLKLNNTQVARAAEHYVVAEIHRRGGYAACFGGNMPLIDVMATSPDDRASTPIKWIEASGQGRALAVHPIAHRPTASTSDLCTVAY